MTRPDGEVLLEERKDARSLTDKLAPRTRLCAVTASTLRGFGSNAAYRHATSSEMSTPPELSQTYLAAPRAAGVSAWVSASLWQCMVS